MLNNVIIKTASISDALKVDIPEFTDYDLEGEFIDAATKEGLEEAKKYNIGGVPVVLFFNEKNEIISEARSIGEVKRIIENKSLSDA